MESSPTGEATLAADSPAAASFADMGRAAAREDWASAAALLTVWAGQPPLRPSIDVRAPSERPAPPSLDIAAADHLFAATDAEDSGLGLSGQQKPGLTEDWWLDLVLAHYSLLPLELEVLVSD